MRQLLIYLFFVLLGQVASAQTSIPGASYSYEEKMPIFPGGQPGESQQANNQRLMEFLNDSLQYPPQARRDGVQGKVFVAFTVDSAGCTTNIKLVKGLRADVDGATLRNFRRLERILWRPGTQNSRPVAVSYTVPITYSLPQNLLAQADSLDTGPFQKLALPIAGWNSNRLQIPTGKGLIYGSFLQRWGGSSSFGAGEYVRLVNLETGKALRINVKPALKSSRENVFCYALPAGRYALFLYEFPDPVWGGYRMHVENIRKHGSSSFANAPLSLAATRYWFTVEENKLHYVGTWNLANENDPRFLDEKTMLDGQLQKAYGLLKFEEARVAMPK